MEKKIEQAIDYVKRHGGTVTDVNDAANIFSNNEDEYNYIFAVLAMAFIA